MRNGNIRNIAPGERLAHPLFGAGEKEPVQSGKREAPRREPMRMLHPAGGRQRGATMIEFAVVGPILILLGLAILQYGLMFFAKNQMNHAAFMAARAGSTGNASLGSVQEAYVKALIPLYGGGTGSGELAAAYAKASADVGSYARIEMLNPTKESFDDWNDPVLQATLGGGKRVIPNGSLAAKNPNDIGATSGQSIQDANLIKLRIIHGYEPKVPLMGLIYRKYQQWLDTGSDAEHTRLVNAGRIPMVTSVTLQMQSDAIEGQTVSSPGMGNDGQPVNPGDPPVVSTPPPSCTTIGCTDDPRPPACNPATDPNQCRPPFCQQGDSSCDTNCGKIYCCLSSGAHRTPGNTK